MKPIDESALRVFHVIDSCKTLDQMKGAMRYLNLWFKKLPWFSPVRADYDILNMYWRDKYLLLRLTKEK